MIASQEKHRTAVWGWETHMVPRVVSETLHSFASRIYKKVLKIYKESKSNIYPAMLLQYPAFHSCLKTNKDLGEKSSDSVDDPLGWRVMLHPCLGFESIQTSRRSLGSFRGTLQGDNSALPLGYVGDQRQHRVLLWTSGIWRPMRIASLLPVGTCSWAHHQMPSQSPCGCSKRTWACLLVEKLMKSNIV